MKNVYFYIIGNNECLLKKQMGSPPRMGEKVRLSGGGQGEYIVHDVINHVDIESLPSSAPQLQQQPQQQGVANEQHAAQQMLAQIQLQQLKMQQMQQAQQTQQQPSADTVEVILRPVTALQQAPGVQ